MVCGNKFGNILFRDWFLAVSDSQVLAVLHERRVGDADYVFIFANRVIYYTD